jgi:hypothetical protein
VRFVLAIGATLLLFGCGDDTGTAAPPDGQLDGPAPDARPDGMPDAPGPPDAPSQLSDAGNNTTPVTPHVIPCGLAGETCDTTGNSPRCCGSRGTLSFMCVGNGANPDGGSCDLDEDCDGAEDCNGAEVCCGVSQGAGALAVRSRCQASCGGNPGEHVLCHNHTQCPSQAPICCTGMIAGIRLPSGACTTAAMIPQGAVCDTP